MRRKKFNYKIITIFIILFLPFIVSTFILFSPFQVLVKKEAARWACKFIKIYDPYKNISQCITGFEMTDNSFKKIRDLFADEDILRNLEISKLDNPPLIKSNFSFSYQNSRNDSLEKLRLLYNLLRFNQDNDFETFIDLKDWLRRKFQHGTPPKNTIFNNFNFIEVTNSEDNGLRFDCGLFSYAYVQCVLALGGQARVLLLEDANRRGHVVTEVWSNFWNKWVVVDVDHNLHYESNGIPLNALEIHNAYIKNDYVDVKIIRGPPLKEEKVKTIPLEKELSKYYIFAVRMRNDFLEDYPRWHCKGNLYTNSVQWFDIKTPRLTKYIYGTDRMEDLYWNLNNTEVYLKKDNSFVESNTFRVFLETITPNFKNFCIILDGRKKEFFDSPEFLWNLHSGLNSLRVCSVNQSGEKGRETKIDLILK